MSKEKQIEEMAEALRHTCEGECFTNVDGLIDCEVCRACYLYEAGYRKQSEWVSVEERLPEDVYGGDRKIITVLVCTKSGRVSTASRVRMMRPNLVTMQYEYTDIFEWSGQIAKKVTHWMPVPEAPKGGE